MAEFPDRVRQSLDHVRNHLVQLRSGLQPSSPVDKLLASLNKTILIFFDQVEDIDWRTCNATQGTAIGVGSETP